jgi:hypothetical protein
MLLWTKGVLLESELSISYDSDIFCQSLLKTECRTPEDSLLHEDIYRDTIADLADRNKSQVIPDVGRLYVPSVQTLAKICEKGSRVFVESVAKLGIGAILLLIRDHNPTMRSALEELVFRKLASTSFIP